MANLVRLGRSLVCGFKPHENLSSLLRRTLNGNSGTRRSTATASSEPRYLTEPRQQPELSAARTDTPLEEFRFIYGDFVRHPDTTKASPVLLRLERQDMMRRRVALCVPEFHVGSVMAVTVADEHAPGKKSRFVGICIHRAEHGVRHFAILRNIVEGHGIEILYDLYNPTLLSIEVLKLEKRLDEHLFYLRDAPQEYSAFPFDMEAVPHPEGTSVPVNPLKVPLKPRPWTVRWERRDMEGILDVEKGVKEVMLRRALEVSVPWDKYDLMKEYRRHVPREEQMEAFAQLEEYHKWNSQQSQQMRRRRTLVKPVKTA